MDNQTPHRVTELIAALERRGFSMSPLKKEENFGNATIVAQSDRLRIRILCDRGMWAIEAAVDGSSEWYDIALLKEEISGRIGEDVIPFDAQASYLLAHIEEIGRLLARPVVQSHLDARKDARASRRLGILYAPPTA